MAVINIARLLREIESGAVHRLLPERPRKAHKGDFGKLLLICGSEGYTGAAVLAAQAASRKRRRCCGN